MHVASDSQTKHHFDFENNCTTYQGPLHDYTAKVDIFLHSFRTESDEQKQ